MAGSALAEAAEPVVVSVAVADMEEEADVVFQMGQ
jgi:hypothetical protein